MKLAIIGSRSANRIEIDRYIPAEVTEIVSGGADGIDTLAKKYAIRKQIPLKEFLPAYHLYGRAAPIKRNEEIAEYADQALAFWDGSSKGTQHTIRFFQKRNKPITVILIHDQTSAPTAPKKS